MKSNQLRKQHKILIFLKDRKFKFYNNNENEKLELVIKLQELSTRLNLKEEDTLVLLTNLCYRELVGKSMGSRWEYVITDEGTTACLEERLLREASSTYWDKLTKKVTLTISIISSLVALLGFIYNYSIIDPLKKQNKIQETKITNLEVRLRIIQESKTKKVH